MSSGNFTKRLKVRAFCCSRCPCLLIYEGERVKCEVKSNQSIKKDEIVKSRIIEFLNSNLGIWLLSTVAVSFFTYSYAFFDANLKEAYERKSRFSDIRSELTNRIDIAFFIVSNENVSEKMLFQAAELLDSRSKSIFVSPEFENASVRYVLTRIKNDFPECKLEYVDSVVDNLGVATNYIPLQPYLASNDKADENTRLLIFEKIRTAKSELIKLFASCVFK